MLVVPANPEKGKTRLRNAEGKFVSKDTPLIDTASKTATVSGAGATVKKALADPTLDKPLVSFQINNPFRKILQWIKEIKNKQTTTFEFKVKVPLIALPVFFAVLGTAFLTFFNLGKETQKQEVVTHVSPTQTNVVPTPTISPIIVSKVGTVKATFQVLGITKKAYAEELSPTPTPTITPTLTNTPTPTMTPTPTPPPSRFVLLDKDEKVLFLIAPNKVKLDSYMNKRVLVTGLFDQQKNTLEIKTSEDIEILP